MSEKERRSWLVVLAVLLFLGMLLIIVSIPLLFELTNEQLVRFGKNLLAHKYVIGENCPIENNDLYTELNINNYNNNYDFKITRQLYDSVYECEVLSPITISHENFVKMAVGQPFLSEQGIPLVFVGRYKLTEGMSRMQSRHFIKDFNNRLKQYNLATDDIFVKFRDCDQYFCIDQSLRIISGPFNQHDPEVLLYKAPIYIDDSSMFSLSNDSDDATLFYTLTGEDFKKSFDNYVNVRGKCSLSLDGKTLIDFKKSR